MYMVFILRVYTLVIMLKEEILQINKERLKLYAKGLNDTQIAEAVGVKSDTITKWRNSHNLPRRNLKLEERMNLYLSGLSDAEIVEREGSNIQQVSSWRLRHNLPCNKAKHLAEKLDKRFALLYGRGYNDSEIAKRWHVCVETVIAWRKASGRQQNPKNRKSVKMADNIKEQCAYELEKVHGRQVARRFSTMIWNREAMAGKKMTDDDIIDLKNRFDDEVYRELLGKRGK